MASLNDGPVTTATRTVPEHLTLQAPTPMRYAELLPPFDRYMAGIPQDVLGTPSMMSEKEREFLYNIAKRYYRGAGRIVDAGIFLGASTHCFAAGLRANTQLAIATERWGRPIVSLERGIVSATMPAHFARSGIGPGLKAGDSFAELIEGFVSPHYDLVELRLGDIMETGTVEQRIEILFLDVLKMPSIALQAVTDYFPHLIPGRSIVIQQDYFFEQLPFIKTYQEAFKSKFEYVGEVGSSAIFRCVEKITAVDVRRTLETLDNDTQLRLASVALQRSRDPIRRLMMAMSRTRLVRELQGAPAARQYLDHVEQDFPEQLAALPPRLQGPWRDLLTACGGVAPAQAA